MLVLLVMPNSWENLLWISAVAGSVTAIGVAQLYYARRDPRSRP